MAKKKTVIDLFCGAGGFSKGFEQAGFECLLGVDHNKDSVETFKLNHPSAVGLCLPIEKLTKKKLNEVLQKRAVDVIIGGPPCQGFSTVGKGCSEDPRNQLFLEFLRIVRTLKPKAVVMENVTGLLAKKNELTLKSIFKKFHQMGYLVDARVLCAEEYGVAETRRRTIIVCSKKVEPLFPQISHGERGKQKIATLKDCLKNLKAPDGKIYNHDVKTAELKNELDRKRLRYIPEGRGIRYQHDEKELLPKSLHYNVDWDKISEGRFRQAKLQRLSYQRPSFTIMTSRTNYIHPRENRYLTAREAAAIQSFPNDFVFCGSLTSQFRQIGNAVPVKLAQSIGESILKMISSRKKSTSKNKELDLNFKKRAFHYNSKVAA